MADIFISYSSKDWEKANQLSELLASAGLSVWIDQHGIDAATSWSEEIVEAIDSCTAFVVMLSPHSIASGNVVKEVSLASEKHKKILPLDIEPVELPKSLQYALAGIQRAPMSNIDAIIRALGKLGLEATRAPTLKLVKETDSRKSLMILPFEDLSPTGDNSWFTDGIASELILALTNVKALRVADFQTTKDYKSFKGRITEWAKELSIRYFIEGQVRKFGDQIKISITLLDIETGDHLWQDSMKGTMNDIFDIQEKVAESVVEGLKIHLATDEQKKLTSHGTHNPEAYELYLKAGDYFERQTKEGYRHTIQLLSNAILLDPDYAFAYQFKALALAELYRVYDRDPALLDEAESLCDKALRLKPDLLSIYEPLSQIYIHRGKFAEAEAAAQEYIRNDPSNDHSHAALGFCYGTTGQFAKAIAPFEESVRLGSEDRMMLMNLISSCDAAGEVSKRTHWSAVALPLVKRWHSLHPDDEHVAVQHALLLYWTGNTEAARTAATELRRSKDGVSLYNTACLLSRLGDKEESLLTFREAIAAGLKDARLLKEFLVHENGAAALIGTPQHDEATRIVEQLAPYAQSNG